MYREPLVFYNYEVIDYDRKSRFDDPLLSVEEVLERHAKIKEEYALKYLSGPIPEENKYQEVGSGETLDKRPEILKVLKKIESPAIKAILVVDVQRLSRGDLEDAGRLIKLLRYTNTCVITPHKTYDLRDEYDRDAFERELKRGSEYLEYYKKIQARGKLSSVKEGNYVGSVAPYGYDRIKVEENKKHYFTLKEKKDEADIVRLIFQWYCNDDIGVTAICRRLEGIGAKSKGGKSHWKASMIFTMLENHHYIGYVRWNWRKTVKIIEDSEIRALRPKAKVDEFFLFEGKHEGIVSEEMFNKAAEIRGKRHRTKRNLTLQNPLSGIMFCKCGAKIGYNTYRRAGVEFAPPKLVCNNQVHCKTGSATFSEVMEYVKETIKECIEDFEVRVEERQDTSVKLHETLIKNLKNKMKSLEDKEVAQWEAQTDPDPSKRMPQEIFKRLNEKLRKEKEDIEKALSEAYESAPEPIDYENMIVKFTDVLEVLENEDAPATMKNQYLRDIIERIDYYRPTAPKGARNPEPYKISIELRS